MNNIHPLDVNQKTGEVFLRLRDHPNIILTPPRWEDAAERVVLLNDPKVYEWFATVPRPYTLEHATEWLRLYKPDQDKACEGIKAGQRPSDCWATPVCILRELTGGGLDVFIGTCLLVRCLHGELMHTDTIDPAAKKRNEEENNALPAGDPNIQWSITDFLAHSHQGKGIMTDAIKTLLYDWAIPRMNVKKVLVGMFEDNIGSMRVFEKNGFRTVRIIRDLFNIGGQTRHLRVMHLCRDEDEEL